MRNLAPLIPEERRFSQVYRGRPELIDHIFVSYLLAIRTTAVTTVTADGALPSSGDNPKARRGKPGSDTPPSLQPSTSRRLLLADEDYAGGLNASGSSGCFPHPGAQGSEG